MVKKSLSLILAIIAAGLLIMTRSPAVSAAEQSEIPANLEEAFAIIDELYADKLEEIRNAERREVFQLYNEWALGRGGGVSRIVRDWIEAENSPLRAELAEIAPHTRCGCRKCLGNRITPGYGVESDFCVIVPYCCTWEMAMFVITSHYYYLRGEVFTIEMFIEEIKADRAEDDRFLLSILALFVGMFLLFVAIIVAVRIFLRKIPRPTWFSEKAFPPKLLWITYILKFLRVTYILILYSPISDLVNRWIYNNEDDFSVLFGVTLQNSVSYAIIAVIFALPTAFWVMFAFADMTRKQVLVSAAVAVVIDLFVLQTFLRNLDLGIRLWEIHRVGGIIGYHFLPIYGRVYDISYTVLWAVGFAAVVALSARCKKTSDAPPAHCHL